MLDCNNNQLCYLSDMPCNLDNVTTYSLERDVILLVRLGYVHQNEHKAQLVGKIWQWIFFFPNAWGGVVTENHIYCDVNQNFLPQINMNDWWL